MLTTDITGAVDISFMIPNNSTFRFRSGTHEIKVMDVDRNNERLAGSVARSTYTAQGVLNTVHQDVKSTRMLELEGSKSSTTLPAPSRSRSNDGGRGAMWNHWQAVKNLPGVQSNRKWNSSLGMITSKRKVSITTSKDKNTQRILASRPRMSAAKAKTYARKNRGR